LQRKELLKSVFELFECPKNALVCKRRFCLQLLDGPIDGLLEISCVSASISNVVDENINGILLRVVVVTAGKHTAQEQS
jgi:hypothetical protein